MLAGESVVIEAILSFVDHELIVANFSIKRVQPYGMPQNKRAFFF